MSTIYDLSKWSDSRLAEDSNDDASLGVAKLAEHKRHRQEVKARERREEEEAARHATEEWERREREVREAVRRVSSAVPLLAKLACTGTNRPDLS